MTNWLVNRIIAGCLPMLQRNLLASSSALVIIAITALVVNGQTSVRDERRLHALIAKVIIRAGGYNAERTRMDLPISLAAVTAVQATSTQPIVRLPTAGGSLPLSIITDHLRTVTMTVPIANYDNNQHAENENLRLQNLWDGIETMAAVMTIKPKF